VQIRRRRRDVGTIAGLVSCRTSLWCHDAKGLQPSSSRRPVTIVGPGDARGFLELFSPGSYLLVSRTLKADRLQFPLYGAESNG